MRGRNWLLGITFGSLVISLLIAFLAEAFLEERIPVLGAFAGFQKSHNLGIAFGIGLGPWQTLFILFALALVAIAAWKSANTAADQVGYGLILGGGLANLIDRLIDGQVTDMIQIGGFPIFNVADVCINLGVATLLLTILRAKIRAQN